MAIIRDFSCKDVVLDAFNKMSNPSAIVTVEDTTLLDNTRIVVRSALDCRIVRQGIVQAVLQSPALIAYCTDLPSYEKMVKELAEKFINWVWED